MNGKDTSGDRARRFTNETNGRKLLHAVRTFQAHHGWSNMAAKGFWEAFAGWAAADADLRRWAATGHAWSARYRRAEFRFSTAGEQQAAEVGRVLAAAMAAHVSIPGLWAAIGGPKSAASTQLNAERPWEPGALGRLAERLGVSEASLRGPAAPMQEPLPMEQRRRRALAAAGSDHPPPARPPEAPPAPGGTPAAEVWDPQGLAAEPLVQQAAAAQGDLAAAVTDAEELRRLRRLFVMLDKLARMGARLDARDLRQIVGYGRGRDLLDMITADRLTEARKTATRTFMDELADAAEG